MPSSLSSLDELQREAFDSLDKASTTKALEELRITYLGRQGKITELLKSLRDLDPSVRPEAGKRINDFKVLFEARLEEGLKKARAEETSRALAGTSIDTSLPGRRIPLGHIHPITQVMQEIVGIFSDLGCSVHEGPEIETEYYNFEALNVAADHPARDMQDTFYVQDGRLLRTHTSPVQVHVMETSKPPIYMIAPGAVYRRDNDVSHSPMFHQVEGLCVDTHLHFGHLKGMLSQFCQRMFGSGVGVRFRPSFFPFTEPSAEVDISCVLCNAKGCRVCKQTGWLEILGCGMVDPNVFKAVGIDAKKYSGFAFGMGVERIAMLKFRITDIRLFYENDLRFLEQF